MTSLEELDAFIDESILRSQARGYYPTAFVQMRKRWGTHETIKRLVVNGEIQSGFRRLKELDLLDWSIEAAVLKAPALFGKAIHQAAEFRLRQASLAD